jgi:Xaa-Pro aminopeptidase
MELQPLSFEGSEAFSLETSALIDALNEARVHKTAQEVELLQYVSDVGSRAHVAMMKV